jgi:3,4-dihydroxy 2-butanone 4-phosphate synthase/GTP cyclohydrolase II
MSIEALFACLAAAEPPEQRPVVMVSYAQSLDGSIALRRGESLALSSQPSLAFTHRLRANHDAILVGVGTVLADNPRLTVRLVPGNSPQPVVLDTHLRFPSGAALLDQPRLPWIVTGPEVNAAKRMALQDKGVSVLALPLDAAGRVTLPALLAVLRARGVRRLMVEGGAAVLTSFLVGRWVDFLAVTVSPLLVGGLHALTNPLASTETALPRLRNPQWVQMGPDLVIWGECDS